MAELSEQELRRRCWIGSLSMEAQRIIERKELPFWLKEIRDREIISKELRKAGLRKLKVEAMLSIMLLLWMGLRASKPRSPAQLRKDLARLREATRTHVARLSNVQADLWVELEIVADQYEDEDGNPVVEFVRPHMLKEAIRALDSFMAATSEIDIARKNSGEGSAVTTLVLMEFVSSVTSIRPDIKPATLSRLAEALFEEVIGSFEKVTGKEVKRPDWHDRITSLMKK